MCEVFESVLAVDLTSAQGHGHVFLESHVTTVDKKHDISESNELKPCVRPECQHNTPLFEKVVLGNAKT